MDEKAAKEYCSQIRDSHLSEYLDKNIRDFNQAKHNMLGMDMEKMKSLMSQEQEFLKEVYKSIRSPIKDYSYECRSKLEEAKTAYEKPELLEKSFALIDKLEDEFKVGPKTIAFEVGHLSDIELTFLSLEKCYEYKNCYTMPELNREQRVSSQSLNELFSAIEKEHKHLASLHGNIKHNDHDVLLLSRVERFFVKSQGNDLSDLKEISSRALVNGVKTEKELLNELRETNDLKGAYKIIDQNIENHYINNTLERFEHDKQHAKTPDEILSIIEEEQDFLSSQHNNIQYPESNIEVTEKIELAYSQKKDNRFEKLKEISSRALVSGVKTEEELVADLQQVTDLKSAHTQLDKDIEAHSINKQLSKQKEETNSARMISDALGAMHKQQQYLSGLEGNLRHANHSEELTKAINAASRSESSNHIEELTDLTRYLHKNKILDSTELGKYFRSDRDVMELHKDFSKICHDHDTNIINHHLNDIHNDKIVHYDNHRFDCPIKYLEHWKNKVDHHLLPMEHINHRLEQEHEHQNERERSISLDL